MEDSKSQPTDLLSRIRAKRENLAGCYKIDEWLWGAQAATPEVTPPRPQSCGPGQVLKNRALRGDNFFVKQEVRVAPPKKKILICHGLLNDAPPQQGELAVMNDLVREYEVHLWEGPGKDFRTEKLTSGDEFWKKRDRIHPATAAEVTRFLDSPESQATASEWFVLDKAAYDQRFGIPPQTLDLSDVGLMTPEEQQSVLQSVDPATITRVNLFAPHPELLQFVLTNFPHVHTLQFTKAHANWLQDNMRCFQGSSIRHLIIKKLIENEDNSITLDDTYEIETLKLCVLRSSNTIQLASTAKSSIYIRSCWFERRLTPGASIQLCMADYEDLDSHEYLPDENQCYISRSSIYQISSCIQVKELIHSGQSKNIETLWIREAFGIIDFFESAKDFPKLKNLIVTSPYPSGFPFNKLRISGLESLETLKIDDYTENAQVEISNCPNLSTLDVTCHTVKFASSLPALRILKGKFWSKLWRDLDTIEDEALLPELESLHWTYDGSKLVSIKQSKHPKMKNLDFSGCGTIFGEESLRNITVRFTDGASSVYIDKAKKLRSIDVALGYRCSKSTAHFLTFGDAPRLLLAEGVAQRQLEKNKRRQSNPVAGVSFYSRITQRGVEPPTGRAKVARTTGDFQAVLRLEGKAVPLRDYRIGYLDQVTLKDGQIVFQCIPLKLKEQDYTPILPAPSGSMAHPGQGFLKGKLEYGVDYPLPLKGSVARENFSIYQTAPADAKVGFYYDDKDQHVYIRLLEKSAPVEVSLVYAFTPKSCYENALAAETKLAEAKSILSEALREEVETCLRGIPELSFLLDASLPPVAKIKKLVAVCLSFEDEGLINRSNEKGSWAELSQIIKEKCGACEPRSQVFMLCASFIPVATKIRWNGVHHYCEVQNADGDWVFAGELGGGKMIQETQTDADAFVQSVTGEQPKSTAPAPGKPKEGKEEVVEAPGSKLDTKSRAPAQPPLLPELDFTRHITAYFAKHQFDPSQPAEKCISIEVEKKADIDNAMQYVIAHRKDHSKPYLVIHTPADFKRYAKDIYWDKDHWASQPGPLAELLQKGGDIYLNWHNFSREDRDQYAQLFKTPAVLNNQTLPENANIVAFVPKDARIENCPHYFLPSQNNVAQPFSENNATHVDAFLAVDWEELLFADIHFTEHGAECIEKPWRRAILTKTPLVIHRPPADPEFWRLYNQIKIEGRIRIDGAWVEVAPNLLSIDNTAIEVNRLNAFFTCLPHSEELKGEPVLLDENNWHTLYEDMESQPATGLFKTIPGKLAQHADQPVVFYVRHQVAEQDWDRLFAFIKNSKPPFPKKFFFQLAPGCTGPGVPKNDALPVVAPVSGSDIPHPKANACYRSRDPVYLAEILRQHCAPEEKAEVFDVTPNMRVEDLLVSVEQLPEVAEEKADSVVRLPRVQHKKGPLFTALEAGQTVIVQGIVPPELKRALSTVVTPPEAKKALFQKRYLDFNCRRVPIPGRVIFVEPKTAPENDIPWAPQVTHEFSATDYETALLHGVKEEKDKDRIKNIFVFFSAAAYPHSGPAMPPDLGMCWERLQQMKHVLLSKECKLHPHNPIKGLMLYDYDKNGEYYAFLNVLGKVLFDTNPDAPMRVEKYQRLLKEAKQHTHDYTFRLLNTLNGSALNGILSDVLGADWLKQKEPPLFKRITEPLWKTLQTKLQEAADKASKAKPEEKEKIRRLMEGGTKAQDSVESLVDDDAVKAVVIKGPPGTGKTHALLGLKDNPKYACVNGLSEIKSAATAKPKLVLKDEANTSAPGSLNDLQGLTRSPPRSFLEGKLDPNTKVVAAVNPESVAGRFYHDQLRNAHTVYMQLPNATRLQQWLCEDYGVTPAIAEVVIAGAELFKKYRPLVGYSMRDLQSVMQRYLALGGNASGASDADNLEILYRAVEGEFGITIAQSQLRQSFKTELWQLMGNSGDPPKPSESKTFAPEFADAHEALTQALLIRSQVMSVGADAKASLLAYKRCVLLQGSARIGKYTFCENVLKEAGFSINSSAPGQKFFAAHVNDPDFRVIAKQALAARAPFIIRGFNLFKTHADAPTEKISNEKFLGALFMGLYPDTGEQAPPGFLAIALQHPPSEDGDAHALSPALVNRAHVVSIPAYSENTLRTFAANTLGSPEKGASFVQQFLQSKVAGGTVSRSDFWPCLQFVAEREKAAPAMPRRVECEIELLPVIEISKATGMQTTYSFSQRFFAPINNNPIRTILFTTLFGGCLPAAAYGLSLLLQQMNAIHSTANASILWSLKSTLIGLAAGLLFGIFLLGLNALYQSRAPRAPYPQAQ